MVPTRYPRDVDRRLDRTNPDPGHAKPRPSAKQEGLDGWDDRVVPFLWSLPPYGDAAFHSRNVGGDSSFDMRDGAIIIPLNQSVK